MIKKIIVLSVLAISIQAFSMPVSDVGEWTRTMQVVSQLREQYQTLKDQYDTLNQQYGAITGNSGWGDWQNSDAVLQQRQWAPDHWQDALKNLSGGNSERYHQLVEQYTTAYPWMAQETYKKGKDENLSKNYQQQVSTHKASQTLATYAFDDINTHLKSLQELGKQIENAEKNKTLKSSVDLNSRITLEIAYISIEELRMQSLINQQMASLQANQLAQENEAAQFNQAGESP